MKRTLLLALFAVCSIAHAEDSTLFFPCADDQTGVRTRNGPELASRDNKWRAYVTVMADSRGEKGNCWNTTKLLVAPGHGGGFRAAVVEEGTEDSRGNGLLIAGWSRHGHLLAMARSEFQYGSDAFGLSIALYDADAGRLLEPDFAALLARRLHRRECDSVILRVIGFDERDRVLFEADNWTDEAEGQVSPQTACLSQRGAWSWNPESDEVEPVIAGPQPGPWSAETRRLRHTSLP